MAIFLEMSTQDIFSTDLKTVSFFEFQSRLNVDICFYFCFSCGDLFSCLFIYFLPVEHFGCIRKCICLDLIL